MKNISIENRIIAKDQPPYVIAELSANHNGSLDRALKTIEAQLPPAHREVQHEI